MKAAGVELPPDPDGRNAQRSDWADRAITAFRRASGVDEEDTLSDLLADLMHWSDRNNYDFEAALFRAQDHYASETRLASTDSCASARREHGGSNPLRCWGFRDRTGILSMDG